MVEPGDDFDDIHEDALAGPLLPPEDRLWRHPSELGQHGQPVSAEALSARRSWMAATPSRAGAWSAGIVGAVLATGVVLVGGHLTHLLSPPARVSSPALQAHSSLKAVTTSTIATPGATDGVNTTTTIVVREPALTKLASRIANAMPIVLDGDESGVGVVVNSKGFVLVPASLVADAEDISVFIDSEHLVATLVGVDPGTGLAVVRVHAMDKLATASFFPDTAIGSGTFVALVWVDQDGTHTCLGTIDELNVPLAAPSGSPPLLDSLRVLEPVPVTAEGGVIIDGDGHLIGMVTNVAGEALMATPGWLADVVSRDLISNGRVVHGWLGITGETVSTASTGTAVRVVAVKAHGAAADAGVKPGDVIEDLNGVPVRSMPDMMAALYSLPPDQSIVLNVLRGGHLWAARASLASAA